MSKVPAYIRQATAKVQDAIGSIRTHRFIVGAVFYGLVHGDRSALEYAGIDTSGQDVAKMRQRDARQLVLDAHPDAASVLGRNGKLTAATLKALADDWHDAFGRGLITHGKHSITEDALGVLDLPAGKTSELARAMRSGSVKVKSVLKQASRLQSNPDGKTRDKVREVVDGWLAEPEGRSLNDEIQDREKKLERAKARVAELEQELADLRSRRDNPQKSKSQQQQSASA